MARAPFTRRHGNDHARRTPSRGAIAAHAAPDARAPHGGRNRPDETPLPRSWSPKDKYNYIGLSQGNLRVHYKGHGKNHKDAASVRATHPIPAACGIYYFEVKIVSKGRDGYMGIGLSAQGVNMNRLPGKSLFNLSSVILN
uniref:B30.2/SPRY domain-containing protein n=1 Tax=Ficedula albicollis TaxID=59894 RepID=A0A803VI84_FICAL